MSFRSAMLAVSVAMVLVACGGVTRPSVSDWEATWTDTITSIPSRADLGDPPSRQLCDDTVASLRRAESTLLPTPDLAIDATVEEWLAIGKDAFFGCPPASVEFPDFDYAYAELARLEAEVQVVLDLDR